jgi:hypothetical protein
VIEKFPGAFPRLLELPVDLVVRRPRLPRFPYAVILMDLGEHMRVLAMAHAKRRPATGSIEWDDESPL